MCCSDDEDAGAEPTSPWTRDLNALDLNNRGGLPRASKVPLFCRVLRGADSLDMRKVSLKVCPIRGLYHVTRQNITDICRVTWLQHMRLFLMLYTVPAASMLMASLLQKSAENLCRYRALCSHILRLMLPIILSWTCGSVLGASDNPQV